MNTLYFIFFTVPLFVLLWHYFHMSFWKLQACTVEYEPSTLYRISLTPPVSDMESWISIWKTWKYLQDSLHNWRHTPLISFRRMILRGLRENWWILSFTQMDRVCFSLSHSLFSTLIPWFKWSDCTQQAFY